jgi:hypothetical protein
MPRRSLKSSTALATQMLAEFRDYLHAQAAAAAPHDRTGQAPRSRGESPVGLSETWLDTEAAARHLGLSASSLTKWRMTSSKGPPFCKANFSVRYSLRDLDDWLAARRVTSTSAMAAPATRRQSLET